MNPPSDLLENPSSPPAWQLALRGIRANLLPGAMLQLAALAVVLLYYKSPNAHLWFDDIADWRSRYGLWFSAGSTVFFGAVLPYGVLSLLGRTERSRAGSEVAFLVLFWTWRGIEADLFYRAQAEVFGQEASFPVIARKVLFDQFVYNVAWVVPVQTFLFGLKESGYSLRRYRESLMKSPFLKHCWVVLLSTWAVWMPAVSIIYSLPTSLQLPLCNMVLCFWSLLLAFLSQAPSASAK